MTSTLDPTKEEAGAGLRAVERPRMLVIEAVSKAWNGRPVLEHVDLALETGTLTWLGGHNGAGKTTLLRIAAGMVAPDAGAVRLKGVWAHRERRRFRARVGFLSAGDRGLYPRLTAADHLALWARLALLPGPEVGPAIERITGQLGLGELLPCRADRLSTGQRQRLRLAMALLHDPHVVFLDEPLSSLDELGMSALMECLSHLKARGAAALCCSPRADIWDVGFDNRYWLERGRVMALA